MPCAVFGGEWTRAELETTFEYVCEIERIADVKYGDEIVDALIDYLTQAVVTLSD